MMYVKGLGQRSWGIPSYWNCKRACRTLEKNLLPVQLDQ